MKINCVEKMDHKPAYETVDVCNDGIQVHIIKQCPAKYTCLFPTRNEAIIFIRELKKIPSIDYQQYHLGDRNLLEVNIHSKDALFLFSLRWL